MDLWPSDWAPFWGRWAAPQQPTATSWTPRSAHQSASFSLLSFLASLVWDVLLPRLFSHSINSVWERLQVQLPSGLERGRYSIWACHLQVLRLLRLVSACYSLICPIIERLALPFGQITDPRKQLLQLWLLWVPASPPSSAPCSATLATLVPLAAPPQFPSQHHDEASAVCRILIGWRHLWARSSWRSWRWQWQHFWWCLKKDTYEWKRFQGRTSLEFSKDSAKVQWPIQ